MDLPHLEQKQEELISGTAKASLTMVSDAFLLAEVRHGGLMPEK